jgi:hypothetical protein
MAEYIDKIVQEAKETFFSNSWTVIGVDGILLKALYHRDEIFAHDLSMYELNGFRPVGYKVVRTLTEVDSQLQIEFNIRDRLEKFMPVMYYRCKKCYHDDKLTLEKAEKFGIKFEVNKLIETDVCIYCKDKIKQEVATS